MLSEVIADSTHLSIIAMLRTILCRYLALGNDRAEFFELTTPLFESSEGVYGLTVPGYKVTRHVSPRAGANGATNIMSGHVLF